MLMCVVNDFIFIFWLFDFKYYLIDLSNILIDRAAAEQDVLCFN